MCIHVIKVDTLVNVYTRKTPFSCISYSYPVEPQCKWMNHDLS